MVGFDPDEIAIDEPTRRARLKWVVAVDVRLPAGRAVNAAICIAAAVGAEVSGVLGPDAQDEKGVRHPGLPWAGCSVLGATAEELEVLWRRASESEGVHAVDMPAAAQLTRVYGEYLRAIASGERSTPLAVSVFGPRNRVDRLTKGLALLE